jgi:hypothetical protein
VSDPTGETEDCSEQATWPEWFEKGFLPYLTESTLWPVLFVLSAHLMIGLALLVLSSFVDRSVTSMLGLALSLLLSGLACQFEREHRGKLGVLTVVVVGGWLLTVGVACGAHRFGFY